MRQSIIKRTFIKLLKKSGKQFYNEQGEPISPSEYAELVLKTAKEKPEEFEQFKKEANWKKEKQQ